MENIKESKYKKFYKLFTRGDKKVRLTVFLGIAGIALIFFSMFWGASPGDKNTAVNTPEAVKSQTTGDYVKLLEENLLYILKSIEDVGESRALITLESGVEYVYADVERTSADNAVDYDKNGESKKTNRSSSKNTIVLVDSKD
ncbi:MAG: hypothetical protein FWG69_06230, partial [Oscillospiraceae bacterium]|nr:hypothetical protein [Oscillospiraceae bacterium]